MNQELQRALHFFTRETGIMAAMTVACGDALHTEWAEDGEGVNGETLFDLASITKLFTGLCALRLRERGLLDLSRPVADYDQRFSRLAGVTVGQVLGFQVLLQTEGRVDACPDRASALRCLWSLRSSGEPGPGQRAYSDMPAMVMKYVVEAAAGETLWACVQRYILQPAGMTRTFARVPEGAKSNCQRYDGEHRIEGNRWLKRTGPEPGIPHDPKAALLQGDTSDLCGHAGLFSTREDLTRFCHAVLSERIVNRETLRDMAVNRTGRPLNQGFSQFLGYLCYVRHPDQYYSEIPDYMGRQAIGMGGFTGNHLSLDPERGIFTLFLGNRVRDRLTVLRLEEGKNLADYGLREDGVGRLRWTDGQWIPSSVNYVHQKDAHLHAEVARVMGLEKISFV